MHNLCISRTCSQLLLQMMTNATQQLTRPSTGPGVFAHDLFPCLRSMDMPLQLQNDVSPAQSEIHTAAANMECTPRMIGVTLADASAGMQPTI